MIAALLMTGAVSGVIAALVFRPTLPHVLPRSGPASAARQNTGDPYAILVAQAKGASVAVRPSADDAVQPTASLNNPTEDGAPLVFVVKDQRPGWYYVLLPTRPNGSVGWIKQDDVTVTKHDYRMVVELAAHRLTVYYKDGIFLRAPVGIGKGPTPTPIGVFYTKELLQPPDQNTAYGAYAYGLSGFSNVLTDFAGGDGVVGLHGTNDPATIGKDVSHGCIRLTNENITRLAKTLPLGVPVTIQP